MPRPRGLPKATQMRHDEHYVEGLSSGRGAPIGKMIDIDALEPNPDQPRTDPGDLSDLVASVKEKGVLAPILVRRLDTGRYQIIAGERRYRAAREAGLRQMPCIEMEVDDRGTMEISLIENIQRRDLSPFEEADTVIRLLMEHGYTQEMLARKLGKSRTTISETASLANLPQVVREECRRADIRTRSTLLEIARLDDQTAMLALVRRISRDGLTRDQARDVARPQEERRPRALRPYVFRYQPENESFRLRLQFTRPEVDRGEVIAALRHLLRHLEEEKEEQR